MNHLSHLTDEELIAAHYCEADPRRAEQAGAHLAACAQCREQSANLASELNQLQLADAPTPSPDFPDRIWSRVRTEILSTPPESASRLGFFGFFTQPRIRYAALASATALVLALTFFAGRIWEKNSNTHTTIQTAQFEKPHQPVTTPVVVVLLDDHLDRSEQLLVELKHADADDAQTLAPMREEAKTLLVANRKIIKQPATTNDPQMQATLAKLDHLLVKLAADSGNFTPDELTELQDELNANKLLFEIRVLRTTAHDSTVHNGGSI